MEGVNKMSGYFQRKFQQQEERTMNTKPKKYDNYALSQTFNATYWSSIEALTDDEVETLESLLNKAFLYETGVESFVYQYDEDIERCLLEGTYDEGDY